MPRKRKGERSDGRIQIQLDIGRDENGKRVRKFFYGKTRIEAEQKKAEYLAQTTGKAIYSDITLSEWIDEYLRVYPSHANPLYHAQNIVPYNRLKTALGTRPLVSIREADLQMFMNGMKKYSASTISKQMQVTKSVFQKARKNRLISDDPADDLSAPVGTKGTHRALTKQEIEIILNNWQSVYSGIWVMLMLFAGLRRGEMIAIDWSDVDLSERTLTVRQVGVIVSNKVIIEHRTKTRAGSRIIPIGQPLLEALLSIPPKQRSGFICLSAHRQPLTETAVRRGIEMFQKKAGISFRCHDLRHTFCSLLYDGNVDVQTAAYLMGHSDVMVTMRIYTHLSEERKNKSSAALLDFLADIKKQP